MKDQIREELKNYGGAALTQEQKKSLMKISKKGIVILILIWATALLSATNIGTGALGPAVGLGIFFSVPLILLEIKDTIKLRGYDEIYIVPVCIEQPGIAFRGNRRVQGQYYDFIMKMFCPLTFSMERMDPGYYTVSQESIVLIIMGKKGNVLKFFCVKPEKL